MKQAALKKLALGVATAMILVGHGAFADEVEDSISEALDAYKSGEFKDAVESLNYASQLIQQMKGESLQSVLPEPLGGWKAEDAQSSAAGASMLGGGVSAERVYRKGSSRVSITIITDSPMIQGMMMMFSNPMFASSDGGKLTRIKRQKAMVKYKPAEKDGEIQVMVDNRIMVTIDGDNVSEDELMGYAKAIDVKKLEENF